MKIISAAAKCLTPIPSALCALLLAVMPESHAATIVWSGASGTDTNWSTVGNWAGGLPGASDDVKFFNAGATATVSNINNVVDGGSTTQLSVSTVGAGYGVPSREGLEAIGLVARTEGVMLEPVYTGKAMAGLLALIRSGRFRREENVVFIHTGGAPALYAYADEF